eukprot:12611676-Prorocentrum_lima.AAC.1
MTSSLVGSEMCIRDRDQAACQLRGRSMCCMMNRGNWVLCENSPGVCWCCLLYTSDAADDM